MVLTEINRRKSTRRITALLTAYMFYITQITTVLFSTAQITACNLDDDHKGDSDTDCSTSHETLNVDPGVTAGSGAVTGQGAFMYSVPITLPPATKGPTPGLSLEYSSQTLKPGSPLGVGWHLAGTPSIHRCGKTKQHDNVRGGVNYDNSDRLCKDGVRLLGDNRSDDDYWSSNAFYPEGDPGTKIVKLTSSSIESTYFQEYRRGRITATYEQGSYKVKNSPARWHLTELSDRNENKVEYIYDFDTAGNVAYLERVNYDQFSVEFSTEALDDYDEILTHNGKIGTSHDLGSYEHSYRFNKITVYTNAGATVDELSGTNAVRTYHLAYDETSHTLRRSLLTSVQECAANNSASNELSECRRPLVFGWNNHELTTGEFVQNPIGIDNLGPPGDMGLVPSPTEESLFDGWIREEDIETGDHGLVEDRMLMGSHLDTGTKVHFGSLIGVSDWNGDRYSDLLRQEYCDGCDATFDPITGDANSATMHLNIGDTSFALNDDPYFVYNHASAPSPAHSRTAAGTRMYPGDFDGNGIPDLFTLGYGGNDTEGRSDRLYLNPGLGIQGNFIDITYAPDFALNIVMPSDREFLEDYDHPMALHGIQNQRSWNGRTLQTMIGWEVVVGDFNGDQEDDILLLPGFSSSAWSYQIYGPVLLEHQDDDNFIAKSPKVVADGEEFSMTIDFFSWASSGQTPDDESFGNYVRAIDLNGDGLDDLVRQRNGSILETRYGVSLEHTAIRPSNGLMIFLNTGDGNFEAVDLDETDHDETFNYANEDDGGYVIQFADFNADSYPDMLIQGTGKNGNYVVSGEDQFNMKIRLGNGNGTFSAEITPDFLGDVPDLHELNHDGILTDWDHLEDHQRAYLSQRDSLMTGADNGYGGSEIVLFDFNGDGRTDMLQAPRLLGETQNDAPRRSARIYLSNGNGNFTTLRRLPGFDTLHSVIEYVSGLDDPFNPAEWGEEHTNWTQPEHHLHRRAGFHIAPGDFDADGAPDLLVQKWDTFPREPDQVVPYWVPHRPQWFVYEPALSIWTHPFAGLEANNTIATVRAGPVTTEVQYDGEIADYTYSDELEDDEAEVFQIETRAIPPINLVGSVTTRPDSPISRRVLAPVTKVSYAYAGPLRGENTDFLGFARFTETNHVENTTVETLNKVTLNNVLVPDLVEQWAGGEKISTVDNDWEIKTNAHSDVVFAALKKVDQTQYFCADGQCGISSSVEYRYDDYSNRTARITKADGRQDRYELTQYVAADTTNWVIDDVEYTRDSQFDRVAEGNIGPDILGTVKRTLDDLGQVENVETVVGVDPIRRESVGFDYDDYGRVEKVTEGGNEIVFTFPNFNDVTMTVRDPDNPTYSLTSTTRYNRGFGVVTEQVDINDVSTTAHYDDFGQRTSIEVPREVPLSAEDTSMVAEEYGLEIVTDTIDGTPIDVLVEKVWTATNWEGCGYLTETARTVYGYPLWTRVTDSEGVIQSEVSSVYDTMGRVHSQSLPYQEGETPQYTHFYYTDQGRLDRIVPPVGAEITIDYDTSLSVCGDEQVAVSQTRGDRETISCQNLLGDIPTIVHGDLTQSKTLDFAGRVLSQRSKDSDNVESQVTSFTYDGAGRVVKSVNDQRGTEEAVYDSLGRLSITRHYDRSSPALKVSEVTRVYEGSLNRLSKITAASGEKISYEYHTHNDTNKNNRGRLHKVTVDATDGPQPPPLPLTTTYAYHPTGLVKTETRNIMLDWVLTRSYTPMGQLASEVSPHDVTTTYHRDSLGRIIQVDRAGTVAARFENYNAEGQYQLRHPESADINLESRTFDEFNRLHLWDIANAGDVVQRSERIEYNDYDEIHTVEDCINPDNNREYDYDSNGFLIEASGPWDEALSFDYNTNGDLSEKDGLTYVYDTTNHSKIELKAGSSIRHRYSFDKAGRLTKREQNLDDSANKITDNYEYDGFGRLRRVTDGGDTELARFGYDQNGQRYYHKNQSGSYTFYISPTFEADMSSGASFTYTEHVLGPEGRTASFTYTNKNSATDSSHFAERHYIRDQVGSDTVVYNAATETFEGSSVYQPYGAEYEDGSWPLVSEASPRYGFTGRELDDSTGLHYFNARYYDHVLGRFTQADSSPIGTTAPHAAQLNRYAYAANNPVNYTDPSGNIALLAAMVVAILISSFVTVLTHAIMADKNNTSIDGKQLGKELAIGAAFAAVSVGAGSMIGCSGGFWMRAAGAALGASIDTGLTAAEMYTMAGDNPNHKLIWGVSAGAGFASGVGTAMAPCFAAGTPILTDEGLRPIEELELGDYVMVPEDDIPNDTVAHRSQPDTVEDVSQTEWVLVTLHRFDADGNLEVVELLQTQSWVVDNDLSVGATVDFGTSEGTISGRMTVISIQSLQQDLRDSQRAESRSIVTSGPVNQRAE